MTAKLIAAGRGNFIVFDEDEGRDLGKVVQNVVGIGAIKWSAYDALGQRLNGSYLTHEDAARAVESTR